MVQQIIGVNCVGLDGHVKSSVGVRYSKVDIYYYLLRLADE